LNGTCICKPAAAFCVMPFECCSNVCLAGVCLP
jgi:hypothetical protein